MATTEIKHAARANLERAREVQSGRATGYPVTKRRTGMRTAEQNRLPTGIVAAAEKFGVEVSAADWRELFKGAKAKRD